MAGLLGLLAGNNDTDKLRKMSDSAAFLLAPTCWLPFDARCACGYWPTPLASLRAESAKIGRY